MEDSLVNKGKESLLIPVSAQVYISWIEAGGTFHFVEEEFDSEWHIRGLYLLGYMSILLYMLWLLFFEGYGLILS